MWQYTDMIPLLPGILGHGIAGTVVEARDAASGLQVGDRVRVHALLTCGACDDCRNDRESLCAKQCAIGAALYSDRALPVYERYHNGGMAEYVRVPANAVQRLTNAVSDEVGAHIGTLAGSLRALRLAEGSLGSSLVVIGASGASGAAAVRLAPLLGFTTICGVATQRDRLERLSGSPGLTHLVATADLPRDWEDRRLLTNTILEMIGPPGADAVADFTPFGNSAATQAMRALRPGGCLVLSGGNPSELHLSYLEIMRNQIRIKGSRGTIRRDEHEVTRMLEAGRLGVDDLVTHSLPLSDVNRALEIVMSREENPVLVVLRPGE